MFRTLFPILTTTDLDRSLVFYRDLLRGTVTYQFPDDGPPVYVSVAVGDASLGIGVDRESPDAGHAHLWVTVDDCGQAISHLAAAGVVVVSPPEDQPWGERVARVLDPDGNQVSIGQEAAEGAEPDGPTGLS